jgi:hypothetical protein
MGREYFSIIFNVKRGILYSIKYGNNGSGKYFSNRLFAQSAHFSAKTFSLNVMCLTSCIYFYPILPLHEISDRHLTINIMTGGKYLTNRLSSLPSLPSLLIFFRFFWQCSVSNYIPIPSSSFLIICSKSFQNLG